MNNKLLTKYENQIRSALPIYSREIVEAFKSGKVNINSKSDLNVFLSNYYLLEPIGGHNANQLSNGLVEMAQYFELHEESLAFSYKLYQKAQEATDFLLWDPAIKKPKTRKKLEDSFNYIQKKISDLEKVIYIN